MLETDGTLHYTLCGLNYIYLVNGFELFETDYGTAFTIENLDGLHDALANDIIYNRASLSGSEIRFLRKKMDMSQSALAKFLGVDSQTVARWEKAESIISAPADRLIRTFYQEIKSGKPEAQHMVVLLNELDEISFQRLRFEETKGEWRKAS